MITRRKFLGETTAVVAAATLIPIELAGANPPIVGKMINLYVEPPSAENDFGNVVLDLETKVFTITKREPMTLISFHRLLQDAFDRPYYMSLETPTMRITDQLIHMINGYSVDENSIGYLRNGTLHVTRTGHSYWYEPVEDSHNVRITI